MQRIDEGDLKDRQHKEFDMLRMIQSFFYAGQFLAIVTTIHFLVGCGGPSAQSYIPKTALAKDALEEALKKWQSGANYGTVKSFSVPIEVFDARWQKGKKLETYQIVREDPSEGPKTFVVNMKLADEKEQSEVKYMVVGKNPLMIYAEQDYKNQGM